MVAVLRTAIAVTVSDRVRAELRRLAEEGQEVDRGLYARLARRYGCSREWVRVVARRLGLRVRPRCYCPCGSRKTASARSCRRCWEAEHGRVLLRCSRCGREFQRLRSRARARRPRCSGCRRRP